MTRPLTGGIFSPLPVFFDDNEDLDLESYKKHVTYLAKAGVKPVVSGTMGEAVHLTHSERAALVRATREALDSEGFKDIPIMAGIGTTTTRETIEFAKEAAEAGADHAILITPGFFAGALKEDSHAGVKQYFIDVAAASPLPVLMYNFPGVTGGIDMDSDLVNEVARVSPNIVGIKLTCGAVGKLTRIAAFASSKTFKESYPRKDNTPFLIMGGFVDILYPSFVGGAGGSITGVANFAPRATVRLWELVQQNKLEEARELQGLLSRADWDTAKLGIPGMKYLLNNLFGYNVRPRRPLLNTSEAKGAQLLKEASIIEILELERKLAQA